MKKIFILLLCGIFYGCQTTPFYINEAMKAKNRGFEDKLPNLEVVWENETGLIKFDKDSSFVHVNTPYANKFYREVETNLINVDEEKRGYIVLTPVISTVDGECCTLEAQSICAVGLVLGLFTAPLAPLCTLIKPNCRSFTELEARVLDKNGKLIKKYSSEKGIHVSKIKNWNKECSDMTNCAQKAQWLSYEGALEDMMDQIYNDRAFLRSKLLNQN